MKKIKYVLLLAILFIPTIAFGAEKEEVNVYIFHRTGCGFCERALAFFESIEDEYGDYFELVKYNVAESSSNMDLMDEVGAYFGETVQGVPYIVVGSQTFPGYIADWDQDIIDAIMLEYNADNKTDAVKDLDDGQTEYDGNGAVDTEQTPTQNGSTSNYGDEENQNTNNGSSNNDIITYVIFAVVIIALGGLIFLAKKMSDK